jgi:hypothetical protein
MRGALRWLPAALLVAIVATMFAVPAPARAQPNLPIPNLPGVSDCKEAPTPEVPGRGLTGFFSNEPKTLPPPGDPFAENATTTIYEQYGYAGLRWNTYDLGCGPSAARNPDATVGTAVADWIFNLPKMAVAATNAVVEAAFNPTFLGVFNDFIVTVVDTLRRTVFDEWVFLVLAAMGFLLIWQARKASLASSTAAVGWALLVMVIATFLFRWPLQAGQVADQSVSAVLGAVSGGLNGQEPGKGSAGPASRSAANLHESILYESWLAGEFGNANSATARKYGPALFDAQALTWREARILRDDPDRGREIVEAKKEKFKQTAAQVQRADPDAYEYLTGKRSDTRVGFSFLAGLAALCGLPFLFVSALLVIGALLIIRMAVMLFPAFATLGVFPTMRGLVIGVGNTVAAALINCLVFGIGAAITIRGIGVLLAPESALPTWLVIVLMLLLTLVMWVALSPFRRLTQMIGTSRAMFGDFSGGIGTTGRRFGQFGRRVVVGALGSFAGTSAALAAQDDEAGNRAGKELPNRTESWSAQGQGGASPATAAPNGAAGDGATTGGGALGAGTALAVGTAGGLAAGAMASSDSNGPPAPEPDIVPAGAGAAAESLVSGPNGGSGSAGTALPDIAPTPTEAGGSPLFIPEDQPLTPMEAATPAPVEPDDVEHDDVYVIYRPGEDGGDSGGR